MRSMVRSLILTLAPSLIMFALGYYFLGQYQIELQKAQTSLAESEENLSEIKSIAMEQKVQNEKIFFRLEELQSKASLSLNVTDLVNAVFASIDVRENFTCEADLFKVNHEIRNPTGLPIKIRKMVSWFSDEPVDQHIRSDGTLPKEFIENNHVVGSNNPPSGVISVNGRSWQQFQITNTKGTSHFYVKYWVETYEPALALVKPFLPSNEATKSLDKIANHTAVYHTTCHRPS